MPQHMQALHPVSMIQWTSFVFQAIFNSDRNLISEDTADRPAASHMGTVEERMICKYKRMIG
jgi:hypothetical protein